jgi:hypothetical protein
MDPNSIQLLSDLLNDPEKEEDDIEVGLLGKKTSKHIKVNLLHS